MIRRVLEKWGCGCGWLGEWVGGALGKNKGGRGGWAEPRPTGGGTDEGGKKKKNGKKS